MISAHPVVHVVDDDAAIRAATARLLRTSGYKVALYESGDQLLKRAPDDQPGCILLDLKMPGLSGLDVQDILLKQDSALPIVMLTGYGDIATSVKAIRAGAVDFLAKPVNAGTLLEAIGRAIAQNNEQLTPEQRNLGTARPDPLTSIGLGKHQYLLRAPIVPKFRNGTLRIGYLKGQGYTEADALRQIGLALHQDFQRHWQIPPHERTSTQQKEWDTISSLVDVDAYSRNNPREELAIGRIDGVTGSKIHVTLLTDEPDMQLSFDLAELPPAAAGMAKGQYFEGRFTRTATGEIEWKSWALRPPLRDDEGIWDIFDQKTETSGP